MLPPIAYEKLLQLIEQNTLLTLLLGTIPGITFFSKEKK